MPGGRSASECLCCWALLEGQAVPAAAGWTLAASMQRDGAPLVVLRVHRQGAAGTLPAARYHPTLQGFRASLLGSPPFVRP